MNVTKVVTVAVCILLGGVALDHAKGHNNAGYNTSLGRECLKRFMERAR